MITDLEVFIRNDWEKDKLCSDNIEILRSFKRCYEFERKREREDEKNTIKVWHMHGELKSNRVFSKKSDYNAHSSILLGYWHYSRDKAR